MISLVIEAIVLTDLIEAIVLTGRVQATIRTHRIILQQPQQEVLLVQVVVLLHMFLLRHIRWARALSTKTYMVLM